MDEEEEWPEAWDRNKVYMYVDPDGNKVPVPHGFTVSGAESEKYVNHNVEMRGTLSNLIFSSNGNYAWSQNEDGVWQSENYNVANSTSELVSNEITVGENGGYLSIECSVSSESVYFNDSEDYLAITINNTETGTIEKTYCIAGNYFIKNNNLTYITYNQELDSGTYLITIKYVKDNKNNGGMDRGYVKGGTMLNYNEDGEESVIMHKYGGLVIYEGGGKINDANTWNESQNRNQFVWVPIVDLSRIYKVDNSKGIKKGILYNLERNGTFTENNRYVEPGTIPYNNSDNLKEFSKYNMQGYTKESLYKQLVSDFTKTIASIEKYGGFYIGRYETGNLTSQVPVVSRLNTDISCDTWYNMYSRMKNISGNENIQTSMIWKCLSDEVDRWLIESGDKTESDVFYDSSNWGNFSNTTFQYLNSYNSIATKNRYSDTIIPTGSTERNKSNNIYDLAGNVAEVTPAMEYGSYFRKAVGGNAYNSSGSSWGFWLTSTMNPAGITNSSERKFYGSRAYFYIKE